MTNVIRPLHTALSSLFRIGARRLTDFATWPGRRCSCRSVDRGGGSRTGGICTAPPARLPSTPRLTNTMWCGCELLAARGRSIRQQQRQLRRLHPVRHPAFHDQPGRGHLPVDHRRRQRRPQRHRRPGHPGQRHGHRRRRRGQHHHPANHGRSGDRHQSHGCRQLLSRHLQPEDHGRQRRRHLRRRRHHLRRLERRRHADAERRDGGWQHRHARPGRRHCIGLRAATWSSRTAPSPTTRPVRLAAASGGGIDFLAQGPNQLTITNSTISGNRAGRDDRRRRRRAAHQRRHGHDPAHPLRQQPGRRHWRCCPLAWAAPSPI